MAGGSVTVPTNRNTFNKHVRTSCGYKITAIKLIADSSDCWH
jgi:hypothetical protein